MASHSSVPSDVDADSIDTLVADCREISGGLGGSTPAVLRLPVAGAPAPVDISAGTAARLDGYGEYGS
ncbi:MAG: hypothetical protein M4D85_04075 [Actinomycetota bacterium]|nr:hypothetical protein [Actinomycetota bacterium]